MFEAFYKKPKNNNILKLSKNALNELSKYNNNKFYKIFISNKIIDTYIVKMRYVTNKDFLKNDIHIINNIYIEKNSIKYFKNTIIDYHDTILCKKFIF